LHNCLESINSIYVEKSEEGYAVSPCCLYKNKGKVFVPTLDDVLDNPIINEIREGFKGDWKRPECIDCVHNEEMGKDSKRLRSLTRPADQITSWDLRPGNTCNLQCAILGTAVNGMKI